MLNTFIQVSPRHFSELLWHYFEINLTSRDQDSDDCIFITLRPLKFKINIFQNFDLNFNLNCFIQFWCKVYTWFCENLNCKSNNEVRNYFRIFYLEKCRLLLSVQENPFLWSPTSLQLQLLHILSLSPTNKDLKELNEFKNFNLDLVWWSAEQEFFKVSVGWHFTLGRLNRLWIFVFILWIIFIFF